jgi:PAS domain S-box-containing protein
MSQGLLDAIRDPVRLEMLRRLALLGTPPEPAFDRLTRLAARLLRVPIVLMSLVAEDHQFFKSFVGPKEPWATWRKMPLSHSFCKYVVGSMQPLIAGDARDHPLLCDSPGISDLGMVAYAGVPLITSEGQPLGSFCAIDIHPRMWTDDEIEILRDLSALVMTEIELRSDAIERARAEKALHEESSFRSIIEQDLRQQRDLYSILLGGLSELGEGVMVGEGDKIIFANEAMSQISGYSHAELLSLESATALAVPESLADSADRLRRLGAGEEIGRFEGGLRHKDGHIVPLEIAAKVFRYGDRVQFLSVMRDMTARKQAEQALADREAMLRSIGDNLPNGMIFQVIQEAPDKLYFTYVSEGAARATGATPEQIYADPSLILSQIVEEDQERYWAAEAESFQNLSIFDIEVRMRPPGGELTWRHIRSRPRHLDDGRLAWDGFSIDITDRKRVEDALRASEERFRRLSEVSFEGIAIHDRGIVLDANRTQAAMLGYEQSEIIGMSVVDFAAPESRELILSNIRAGNERPYEVIGLRKDGSRIWVEVQAKPISYQGQILRVAAIRDITERKRAEQEREELIAALREALANIKTLRGLLPICASCKKIRDDSGYWSQIEAYIQAHSDAVFSHGICPDCASRLYGDIVLDTPSS